MLLPLYLVAHFQTLLFRGTTDSPVGNIRVLDAPRGLDGSHFQELASKEHPPGAQHITDNSREAQMAARIADLMAQVAEVSNPRQEHQGREKWNSDDVGFGRWQRAVGQTESTPFTG